MKTIIFVTNNYRPYAAGLVKSIDAFTQALRAEGHQVFIITLDFTGDISQDPPWVIRLFCPIRFRYKNNHIAIPWRPYARLKKLIEQLKPDIIHVQHPFFLGYKAAMIARRMQIPCVFTYHTLYEEYAYYVPMIPRSWIRNASISFCNRVDAVIAPSVPVYNYLMQHGVKKPITVIPSPLRSDFLPATMHEKERGQRLQLLYVGRFVKEKNLYTLLDIVAQLPRDAYTLKLIGYGHEEKNLMHYAYEHHGFTQDEVQFIHQPDQNVVRQAYQDADLFIFTSYTDTQGLVLAEAMAAGTPVVALDGLGQRDIIEAGKNGFIAASPTEMVRLIERIRTNQNLWIAMQEAAFKTAQQYAPAYCAAQLLRVYEELS